MLFHEIFNDYSRVFNWLFVNNKTVEISSGQGNGAQIKFNLIGEAYISNRSDNGRSDTKRREDEMGKFLSSVMPRNRMRKRDLYRHVSCFIFIRVERRLYHFQSAPQIFDQMKMLNDRKQYHEVLALFDTWKMTSPSKIPSMVITQVLKACAGTGNLQLGKNLHQMIKSDLAEDPYITASLIHLYSDRVG